MMTRTTAITITTKKFLTWTFDDYLKRHESMDLYATLLSLFFGALMGMTATRTVLSTALYYPQQHIFG
jgi:hypothetical protein